MGNTESLARLLEEDVPPEDAGFWSDLLGTARASADEFFDLVGAEDIRELRHRRPRNLQTLLRQSVNAMARVCVTVDDGKQSAPDIVDAAYAAMRILTRVAPVLHEPPAEGCEVDFVGDILWRPGGMHGFEEAVASNKVVFVLGGPGAGKGTQCSLIVNHCPSWAHISVEDLLSKERQDPACMVGEQINECFKEGNIVPIAITVSLLRKAMAARSAEGTTSFLIEGFPRNLDDVKGWQEHVGSICTIVGVLYYDVPANTLEKRWLDRRRTRGILDDDNGTFRKVFDVCVEETTLILEHFKKDGKVYSIDGTLAPEEVWKKTDTAIKHLEGGHCQGGANGATVSSNSVSGSKAQRGVVCAHEIMHHLARLLFLPQFSVTPRSAMSGKDRGALPTHRVDARVVWRGGVGLSAEMPTMVCDQFYKPRTETLRCLLACLSQPLFQGAEEYQRKPSAWLQYFTGGEVCHTANLFCSLMSTVFAYDPVGWGLPYGSFFSNGSEEELVDAALQLLCILMDFDPSSADDVVEAEAADGGDDARAGTGDQEGVADAIAPVDAKKKSKRNVYRYMLQNVSKEPELDLIFGGLVKLLSTTHQAGATYLPNSQRPVGFYQEALVLLWHLITVNRKFLERSCTHSDTNRVLLPLLYLLHQAHESPNLIGLLHTASFVLLVLSSERSFSVRLNEPYTAKIPLKVPTFTGTHADLMVLALHKVISDGIPNESSDALVEMLLTVICNISPYLKALGLEACVKILSLTDRCSRPAYVFRSAFTHHSLIFLLELLNNVIQYQYEGNSMLVYSILRNQKIFERLDGLELPVAKVGVAAPDVVAEDAKECDTNASLTDGADGDNGASANDVKPVFGLEMAFAEAPPGGFASSYERKPQKNSAFVIPGDEELFVGGGSLNGAVGKLLLESGQHPIAFERDIVGNYVMVRDAGTGREVPKFSKGQCVYRGAHEKLFQKGLAKRNRMVVASTADIGDAPLSFAAARVYSDSDKPFGAAFLNIFKKENCPFSEKNVALLYTVGALGRNQKAEGEGVVDIERAKYVKTNVRDFLEEIYKTGQNLAQLVVEYNARRARSDNGQPGIDVVRVPIVSGGVFINPGTTPKEVALALLWGLHSALAGVGGDNRVEIELMPGADMQSAYDYYRSGAKPSDWNSPERKNIFQKIPCPLAQDEVIENDMTPQDAPTGPPKARVVLVLGAPGAGKGTQCGLICEHFEDWAHLSAKDLVRHEIEDPSSKLGDIFKDYVNENKQVPPAFVVSLLRRAMTEKTAEGKTGFLLDAFPESMDSLKVWQDHIGDSTKILGMLLYDTPAEILEKRLLIGAEGSIDDVRRQHTSFMKKAMPIVEHFRSKGSLITIAGSPAPDEVWLATEKAIISHEELEHSEPAAPPAPIDFGDGVCVAIVGPSGVGKTTLIKKLMAQHPGKFELCVSHTTRIPRTGEKNAIDYNFVGKEAMQQRISQGEFVEHAEVHGNLYGTSVQAVQTVTEQGKVCLLDIDVQGVSTVRKSLLAAITSYIFIAPVSMDILEERLRGRGSEREEAIQKRLTNARSEIAAMERDRGSWDRVVVNDDLARCYGEVSEFLMSRIPRSDSQAAAAADLTVEGDAGPWSPSDVWLQAWRSKMSLQPILCLLHYLGPRVEAVCQDKELLSQEEVIQYLRGSTMVGVLPVPHPIVIRTYEASNYTAMWFTSYLWGVIFTRSQSVPLFDWRQVRLVAINQ